MEFLLSLISIVAVLALGFWVLKQGERQKNQVEFLEKILSEQRQSLGTQIQNLGQSIQNQQNDSRQTLQNQFDQSTRIIQDVTRNLTQLQETNKQVVSFAEQMRSLENILKNPKQRGILGEYFLETLLSNVLTPNQFQMQYKMENNEVVDAMIFHNGLKLPIDAKFSLEKYNMMMEESDKARRDELEKGFKIDVKKRIDETSKYVRPSEGTTDFAFMFIPAEGIYYNLMIYNVGTLDVNSQDLLEYAASKKVTIVSPSSFMAYLQTVLQGMRRQAAEDSIQEILKNISILGRHINAYDEYMQKLGKHLGTTVNTYNTAFREFKKIDKDVYKLSDGKVGGGIDPLLLEEVPLNNER